MSETTDAIDATVTALWPTVVAQQEAYRAAHGCYYQMLWTHTAVPSSYTAPDNLNARPTDQPPHPVSNLPATMRSRFKIDTYGDPDGWVMTLQTSDNGSTVSRIIDCGTDPTRTQAWG